MTIVQPSRLREPLCDTQPKKSGTIFWLSWNTKCGRVGIRGSHESRTGKDCFGKLHCEFA